MGCKWWEETVEKDWETGDVAGKEGMHRREHWTNRRNDSSPSRSAGSSSYSNRYCAWT